VEFTYIELVGGAELAASVENATTGPVENAMMDLERAIAALVEKADRALEKAMADGRRSRDGGRRAVEMGWKRDGDGERRAATLGRDGDVSWQAHGCYGERRGGVRSGRCRIVAFECWKPFGEWKRSSVGEDRTVGPLGWCRSPQMVASGRLDAFSIAFPYNKSRSFDGNNKTMDQSVYTTNIFRTMIGKQNACDDHVHINKLLKTNQMVIHTLWLTNYYLTQVRVRIRF
jgi:hypothetical protein